APGHQLDLLDRRAVHRERALDADGVADLPDGERLAGATALPPDDDALEDLDPGAAALDDADMNLQGVTGPEVRDVVTDLGLLQLGNRGVHRKVPKSSSRARRSGRGSGLGGAGGPHGTPARSQSAGVASFSVPHLYH